MRFTITTGQVGVVRLRNRPSRYVTGQEHKYLHSIFTHQSRVVPHFHGKRGGGGGGGGGWGL